MGKRLPCVDVGCGSIEISSPASVDDLATVWATLPGFTATTPVDITVDGYAGKQVDYTVPDYATVIDPATGEEGADCANHQFGLWTERYGGLGPTSGPRSQASRTDSGSSTSRAPDS